MFAWAQAERLAGDLEEAERVGPTPVGCADGHIVQPGRQRHFARACAISLPFLRAGDGAPLR